MITVTCKQCGKSFETFPSLHKQFCSTGCANTYKTHKVAKNCKQCGNPFTVPPSMSRQEYCSRSCMMTARNLTSANPAFSRDISGGKNPMFGKGFKGETNPMYGKRGELCPNWKGGRRVRPDGYTRVIAPPDHPYPSETKNGTKYILEHRLVVEQHLGRYLLPTEEIHHKDGNPRNNVIDNLEVFANHKEHISKGHPGFGKDKHKTNP